MNDLNKEEEFQAKLRAMNDEIRRTKTSIKDMQEKQKEIEKSNTDQFRFLLDQEDRCRRLQVAIKSKQGSQMPAITSLRTPSKQEPSDLSQLDASTLQTIDTSTLEL